MNHPASSWQARHRHRAFSAFAFGNDGYLYVASRGSRQILRYRQADGAPDQHPFIDGLDDEQEFIAHVAGR